MLNLSSVRNKRIYTLFEIAKHTDSKVVGDKILSSTTYQLSKMLHKTSISFFANTKYKINLKKIKSTSNYYS